MSLSRVEIATLLNYAFHLLFTTLRIKLAEYPV